MTMRGNYNARFHAEEAADHMALAADIAERAVARAGGSPTAAALHAAAREHVDVHKELARTHALTALALAATMNEPATP